ncbi:shikimate kinase [Flagellimonas nanhaiensis]|uniref:Shikimate kinase n=1 Tax=Flagellimonas nanhaiensis TaxID=2292706 RepID=A0A371JL02_9FLAO|nr:shikimate kinase [Allomuricauda nanhaiensis]RDY57622.1 shikimate kinase [Allomuricauda nanhaiensis]
MKVVLIGYMASGKSSVGKLLSKQLEIPFVDLDEYIEEQQKMTISKIFSEKGELFFRKLEHQMLQKVLEEHSSLILSTGGGTPCYGVNMDTILNNSDHSVYLQLSVSGLVDRIANEKDQRPLVSDIEAKDLAEFVGKHLFERRGFYAKAKHTISGDGKDLDTVVSEVKKLLV